MPLNLLSMALTHMVASINNEFVRKNKIAFFNYLLEKEPNFVHFHNVVEISFNCFCHFLLKRKKNEGLRQVVCFSRGKYQSQHYKFF